MKISATGILSIIVMILGGVIKNYINATSVFLLLSPWLIDELIFISQIFALLFACCFTKNSESRPVNSSHEVRFRYLFKNRPK